jgi:hypothetical protein
MSVDLIGGRRGAWYWGRAIDAFAVRRTLRAFGK